MTLFCLLARPARRAARCAMLVLPMVMAGCFTSGVPALTTETAQDVGRSLVYRPYSTFEPPGPEREFFRFVRESRASYRFDLLDATSPTATPSETTTLARDVMLRRISSRGKDPVYLVQFEPPGSNDPDSAQPNPADVGFTIFAVAVDWQANGAIALFDCRASQLRKLATAHHLTLVCNNSELHFTAAITGKPDPDDILAFITEALARGLARWEDREGFSLLDQVM